MSIRFLSRITLGSLVVSSSALQLSATVEERRPKHGSAKTNLGHSVSLYEHAKLHRSFDNSNGEETTLDQPSGDIDHGPEEGNTALSDAGVNDIGGSRDALEEPEAAADKIHNLDVPAQVEHVLPWLNELEAFDSYGGKEAVMKMVQDGDMLTRQSPLGPNSTQYRLRSATGTMNSLTSNSSIAKAMHAKALGEYKKHVWEARQKKIGNGNESKQQKERKQFQKKMTDKAGKHVEKGNHRSHKKRKAAREQSSEATVVAKPKKMNAVKRVGQVVINATTAAKGMASSVVSKVGSIFKTRTAQDTHKKTEDSAHRRAEAKAEHEHRKHMKKMQKKASEDAEEPAAKISEPPKRGKASEVDAQEDVPTVKDSDNELLMFHRGKRSLHQFAAQPTDVSGGSEADPSDRVQLPGLDELMLKPSSVVQALAEKLGQLKASLADKESANRAAVAAQKAKYEANLTALRQNISNIGRATHKIEKEVSSINKDNAHLRKAARQLQDRARELRRQLLALQENMTTVQEFIARTLEVPEGEQMNTLVLRELEEQDASRMKKVAHASALAAIDGISLLQTAGHMDDESEDTEDTMHGETLNYVTQLNSSVSTLDAEQESSELSLRQTFEAEYAMEMERQQQALATQETWIARRTITMELRTRLRAAVSHLEDTVSDLRSKSVGLTTYISKVATR